MPIEMLVSAPNGAQCSYHVVKKVDIDYNDEGEEFIRVIVYSWLDELSKSNNNAPVWGWQLPMPEVTKQFTLLDVLDIHTALVESAASPFIGGTVILGGVQDLEYLRRKKLDEFRREFESRNYMPLSVPELGVFDGDENSHFKITQTVLLATVKLMRNEPLSVNFTRADNTDITLNAQQIITLGFALAQREQELRARKSELRTQVAEATSVEQLQALRWGYSDSPMSATPTP